MACHKISILLCIFLCVQIVLNSKLNVPRVLLPIFKDFSTTFTLEATEGGCYKWTTTRADVISLQPLDADPELCCSTKVVVSTVTKELTRNIAVVLAEDVRTRQILRCDVIVDIIDSLALVTTTRELFMEEAPEAFEVRACDAQGNEFTTLEGIEFDWKLAHAGPSKELTILRFMTFKNSPYETPLTILKIEEQNKKGHIVLLEGIKTGCAKVIVKLPHEEYKHVKSFEVQLSVIANLIITPAEVYIMVGDTVRFEIIHMNNGRMEEIQLPNSQYYLDVESQVVASADKDLGEVTGLRDGKTQVILRDRNIDDNGNGIKLPAATLNVVTPAYMTLSILPHRNWAILLSEHHDIVAEVYSGNDHKLHLGSGVKIQIQVGELFFVQERSKNGSWLNGWAKEKGVAPVQGLLEVVVHPKLGTFNIQPKVTARAELQIYPPIILNPSEIILPWDSHLKPKYEVEIKAVGGDGKFLWSSSNHSVGIVTQSGYVRTHSHGSFEVSAAMMKNHHNRQTAIFHILPPSKLEIVEFVMEAEVGSIIFLHVALYADKPGKKGEKSSHMPFTKCQELPLNVKLSDSNFVHNRSTVISPVGISCGNVAVIGLDVGVSKVTVSYQYEGKTIEDSVTVSTFNQLNLLHPRHDEIVLAVGTSSQLVFTGGPRPAIGRPSLHKRIVTSVDNLTVEAKDVTDSQSVPGKKHFIVLDVLCRQLGSSEVSLSVTNGPVLPNCKNQESTAKINVICGKPRSISLQPDVKVADVRSCPLDLSADRVVVQSYKNIELDVAVTDEKGRRFLNVSSLDFKWTISPTELGELGSTDGVFSRNVTEGTIVYANRSYQIVVPKSQTGIIEVAVTLMGYRDDHLKAYGIVPEWPEFVSEDDKITTSPSITTVIHLYLVDDTVVTPSIISIYNHPGNKKIISVKQGSGYYEIALSSNSIADVKYLEGSRELEIKPLSEGELQINLIDLCLISQPAAVSVYVVSVSIIRVEMSDKVEIGKCISCIVRLYDEADNLLSIPDVSIIDLKFALEVDNINAKRLKEDKKKPWPPGEIHYVITGTELGETKLTFSIGETASAPIELQVFPPLRIQPRNATLLIGSVLQLSSKGGPQPDCSIEYSTETNNIADVSATGLAQGLALGATKINAYAVGINPTTGFKVIYSQDQVDLQVIPIMGIKISIPLARFKIGTTVPAWASGVPEQLTPMIIGTIQPPFRYEWDVDDKDIITLHGPFKQHKIEYLAEDAVSIRLTGLAPGRTTLHLNVIVPGPTAERRDRLSVVYSTSIDLEVFGGLTLTSPKGISGCAVLMAPNCKLQLHTNMDGMSQLRYSLPSPGEYPNESSAASAQRSLSIPNPVITVTDTGLLVSHNKLGRAMVLVTATDEHGLKQTLSIIVEVKPVHYMLLNVVTNWYINSPSPINAIPLGTEFQLKATYHDNTGTEFTSGSAELRLSTTRFDLVRIRPGLDNSSVSVSTKRPGFTVLKAWANGLHEIVDYIKLNVKQIIAPVTDCLTTGDIICVWTPLVTLEEQAGKWSSSDRALVAIDVNTGVGLVIGLRGGQVAIANSLHPSTPLHIQVVPANQIKMLPNADAVLTNTPSKETYQVPLVILSEKYPDKTQNLLSGYECGRQLKTTAISYPFVCKIAFTNSKTGQDVNRVFRVQSSFNPETGQYTCEILPGTERGPNISILDSNVTVWAVLQGGEVEAEPVQVHFIPAVFVPKELILDEVTYSGVLSMSGLNYVLDQVGVLPFDKNLIQVSAARRSSQNLVTHEIRLLDYHWKLAEMDEPLNLVVTSPLTDQIMIVHVKMQGNGDVLSRHQCEVTQHSPIISFIYSYRHTLAIVISMLIIFFITFYTYSHYIQPVINVNVNPNRSLLSSANQLVIPSPRSPYACQYAQRSPGNVQNRNASFSNREPVYGDPSTFYSTSPEVRRNRRMT